MQHIQGKIVEAVGDSFTALKCNLNDNSLSIAEISIKGRSPQKGYIKLNTLTKYIYILSGSGELNINNKNFYPKPKDLFIFEPDDCFFWNGNFNVLAVCIPAFNTEYHENCL